jgi:hypothetical protein
LGAELEAMQLELIRSICEVAMDPKYATEDEAVTALSDAVRDMRPLLDENFVPSSMCYGWIPKYVVVDYWSSS